VFWAYAHAVPRYIEPEDVISSTFRRLIKTRAYVDIFDTGPSPDGRAPVWLVRAVDLTAKHELRKARSRARRERLYATEHGGNFVGAFASGYGGSDLEEPLLRRLPLPVEINVELEPALARVISVAHGETLLAAGEATEAIGVLEAAARTCRERRFVGQLINALKNLGLAYLVAGRPADAIPVTQESVDLQDKAKVAVTQPMMHTTLGLAHLQLGDFERAETSLRRALELAARQDARGLEGWAHLAWAELAHRRGDRAGASSAVDAAQEIAEQLGMRPLLERCRAFLRRD
jgi:tetratricopeptide (TPR) repeat protein